MLRVFSIRACLSLALLFLLPACGGQSGLFFTATDENLPGKQNKVCETTLNPLKLELTYLGKQETWP